MKDTDSDRRKDARHSCNAAVVIEDLDPGPSGRATLLNYSRYGLYIEANQQHDSGTTLFVGMANSPYRPAGRRRRYECHCVLVKWRRQLYSSNYLYGYGLEHRDPPCSCPRDITVPIYEEDFVCTDPEPAPEQRRHPRRPFRNPVYFNAGQSTRQGMVRNISRGGIFIETFPDIQTGVGIKLVIPKTRLAKRNALIGRIVRLDPQGLGIKFTGMAGPKPSLR